LLTKIINEIESKKFFDKFDGIGKSYLTVLIELIEHEHNNGYYIIKDESTITV
jgi:hypothetical protein